MNEFVLIINDSEVFGKSTQTSFFDKKEATTETSGATKPKMFRVKFLYLGPVFSGFFSVRWRTKITESTTPISVPPTTLATTPTAEKFDKENLPPRTDQRTSETRT